MARRLPTGVRWPPTAARSKRTWTRRSSTRSRACSTTSASRGPRKSMTPPRTGAQPSRAARALHAHQALNARPARPRPARSRYTRNPRPAGGWLSETRTRSRCARSRPFAMGYHHGLQHYEDYKTVNCQAQAAKFAA
eukprot:4386840-Prymnesium_polylepis.1